MDFLVKEPSEEWTVVQEERERDPEIIEDNCSYSEDEDIDFAPNLGDDSDDDDDEEIQSTPNSFFPDLKPMMQEESEQPTEETSENILQVPIPYEFPTLNEPPIEISGRVVVEVVGPVKSGKSSLAQSLATMMTSRGWYIKDMDIDSEITVLQRFKSDMTLTIVGASSENCGLADTRNLNFCLFALPPHYVDPATVSDLASTVRQRNFDVVLPVVCKVDSMTAQEMHSYCSDLSPFLGIVLGQKINEIYGVVCKHRVYPWGSVSPDSSISRLRNLCEVLESHLQLDPADEAETHNFGDSKNCQVNTDDSVCCISKSSGCSFMMAIVLSALAICAWRMISVHELVPSFLVDLCTFETLLFLLILTPIGPQKEYSVAIAIAIAIFWRLAEETRQKELYNMSAALQQVTLDNENYLNRLNYCETNMDICTSKFANVSARLYDTTERLIEALELCGSWCLDV